MQRDASIWRSLPMQTNNTDVSLPVRDSPIKVLPSFTTAMSDPIPWGVSKKHVLHSEILLVTSAMRRNSRWATTTHFMTPSRDPAVGTSLGLRISSPSIPTLLRIDREADLMAGFQDLKQTINEVESTSRLITRTLMHTVDASRYRHTATSHPSCTIPCHHTFAALDWTDNFICIVLLAPFLRMWSHFDQCCHVGHRARVPE